MTVEDELAAGTDRFIAFVDATLARDDAAAANVFDRMLMSDGPTMQVLWTLAAAVEVIKTLLETLGAIEVASELGSESAEAFLAAPEMVLEAKLLEMWRTIATELRAK